MDISKLNFSGEDIKVESTVLNGTFMFFSSL